MARGNIIRIMPRRDDRESYSHIRWGEEKSKQLGFRITPKAAEWISSQPSGYVPYLIEALARGKARIVEVDPESKETKLYLSDTALEALKTIDLEYLLEEMARENIVISYRDNRLNIPPKRYNQ